MTERYILTCLSFESDYYRQCYDETTLSIYAAYIVCRTLHVVHCMSYIACSTLYVVHCTLYVVLPYCKLFWISKYSKLFLTSLHNSTTFHFIVTWSFVNPATLTHTLYTSISLYSIITYRKSCMYLQITIAYNIVCIS